MIGNYDYFTYNLVKYLQMQKQSLIVKRNGEIAIGDIAEMKSSMAE